MSRRNILIIAILIVLLSCLALVAHYYISESPEEDSGELRSLAVSSEGPIALDEIINDIETGSYYKGYDNETLSWMKSLGDMQVFVGNGTFVVMDSWDARKIPSQYVTDVYIDEFIECKVLENHSLGDVKYPRDILLVKDVEYLGQEVHNLQGA